MLSFVLHFLSITVFKKVFKHVLFNVYDIKVMAEEIALSIKTLLENS